MNSLISKIVTITLYILIAVSVILFIGFNGEWVSTGAFLGWAYVLFFLAAGITVIAGLISWIMKLVQAPKKAIASLVMIVGLLVVFGIAYALSSDGNVSAKIMAKSQLTPSGSHIIGMSIIAMYILGILAVLAIIYSGVSKLFK